MIDIILKALGLATLLICFAGVVILYTASAGEPPGIDAEPSEYSIDVQEKLDAIEAYPLDVIIVHVYGREETTEGTASYLKEVWVQSSRVEIIGSVKTNNTYTQTKGGAGWTRTGTAHSVELSKYSE